MSLGHLSSMSMIEPTSTLQRVPWEAWIEINGVKAPLYDIKESNRSRDAWFEKVPGAAYTINIKCERFRIGSKRDTRAYAFVDGLEIDNRLTSFGKHPGLKEQTLQIGERFITEELVEPLRFVNQDPAEDDPTIVRCIEVLVMRGRTGEPVETAPRSSVSQRDLVKQLNQAEKGLDVSKQQEVKVDNCTTSSFENYRKQSIENPAFIFRFHCGNRRASMTTATLGNPALLRSEACQKRRYAQMVEVDLDTSDDEELDVEPVTANPHPDPLPIPQQPNSTSNPNSKKPPRKSPRKPPSSTSSLDFEIIEPPGAKRQRMETVTVPVVEEDEEEAMKRRIRAYILREQGQKLLDEADRLMGS